MKQIIGVALFIYIALVIASSICKSIPDENNKNSCDVKIPYDYIVYDRLFCEIK
jgi:hypothetical protein